MRSIRTCSLTFGVPSSAFGCQPWREASSSNRLPAIFQCTQIITNTTILLPITRVSDGSTLSTITSTITAETIGAYGIKVAYSSNDELEPPPDPERFNKVRLAYATEKLSHDDGLSPQMKVGVGVGVCFATGLIALGVLIFLKRKGGSPHSNAADNETLLSTRSTPSSTRHIHRKPVPSVRSSELSVRETTSDEGYQALNTSEVQVDSSRDVARSRGHRRKLLDGLSLWAWEILSLFVSALSLASIIIILNVYDGRQRDEWTPRLSINAVISILSTIFKASLALPLTEGISQLKWLLFAQQPRALSELDIYDKASRGAWGSAMMILGQFKSETRTYLASFGAALALIILAADPFAQATISLYSCPRGGLEIASIPRANNFTAKREKYSYVVYSTFDISMQLASYRGVLEPPANSSASVSVSCTTGNCTFPEDKGATFTSLTMCAQTWDISDRMKARNGTLGYTFYVGSDQMIGEKAYFNMSSRKAPGTSFLESSGSLWNRTSVIDVYLMSMVKDNSTDCKPPLCGYSTDWSAMFRPSAFVFSLVPCLQTFSASLIRGQYSEEVISEEYLHYIPPGYGYYQLSPNRTMVNGTMKQCTGTENPDDVNTIPVYKSYNESVSAPRLWYSPECVYEFYGGGELADFLEFTFFSEQRLSRQPAWVNQLWRNGTTDLALVTDFANGLATSLGALMRTAATGPNMLREARGTTLVEKTCIRIRWGYISFFASVFVLEALFLGAVLVMGYRSRLHVDWKSSTLAVAFLSAGNSRPGGWRVKNPESEGSLQEAARSIKASLDDVSGHWQLRTKEQKS
ncbi:hypothetical protein BBO_04294 [Beauveria brongniartii RCEF 3172]|uniref:Uncharacterized protein n=1 Tax=Beauveria brongniartii RCEF 3172 TaxID=1081107 RepID=A0A162JGB4_9HYPO|nr:hypothetical protein BBO_04294 [Beauveria brongniartii RCEF 3172]